MEVRKGISGKSEVLDELVAKYGDITIVECLEREEIEEVLRRR
ncbi:hypothetical protein [uncultured Ilyobacter sp.]|nr:hypothetical protein [uncultured Ilyobacter sp.]